MSEDNLAPRTQNLEPSNQEDKIDKSTPKRFDTTDRWVIDIELTTKFNSLSLLSFRYTPKVGNDLTNSNKNDLFGYDS